jgi:hypothetical protein
MLSKLEITGFFRTIYKQKLITFLAVLITCLLSFIFGFQYFVWLLVLVSWVLFNWTTRPLAIILIILICSIGLFVFLELDDLAQVASSYAYFSLASIVLLEISRYFKVNFWLYQLELKYFSKNKDQAEFIKLTETTPKKRLQILSGARKFEKSEEAVQVGVYQFKIFSIEILFFILVFLFNLFTISFSENTVFKNWSYFERIYSVEGSFLYLSFFTDRIFNFFKDSTSVGNAVILSSTLQIILTLSFLSNFFALIRVRNFFTTITRKDKALIFLFSFFTVFNTLTLTQIYLGRWNLILAASITLFIISSFFEFFSKLKNEVNFGDLIMNNVLVNSILVFLISYLSIEFLILLLPSLAIFYLGIFIYLNFRFKGSEKLKVDLFKNYLVQVFISFFAILLSMFIFFWRISLFDFGDSSKNMIISDFNLSQNLSSVFTVLTGFYPSEIRNLEIINLAGQFEFGFENMFFLVVNFFLSVVFFLTFASSLVLIFRDKNFFKGLFYNILFVLLLGFLIFAENFMTTNVPAFLSIYDGLVLLYLLLFCFVLYWISKSKNEPYFRNIVIVLVGLYVIINSVLFGYLNTTANYVEKPEVVNNLESECKEGGKKFHLYENTQKLRISYYRYPNQIVINPYEKSLDCQISNPISNSEQYLFLNSDYSASNSTDSIDDFLRSYSEANRESRKDDLIQLLNNKGTSKIVIILDQDNQKERIVNSLIVDEIKHENEYNFFIFSFD